MEPILKLEHIQKYYGNGGNVTKAIQDISFSVSEGEFLGIMGASGSGKTTLLNCISTMDTVSAGHICLEGTDVTELQPQSLARFRRCQLRMRTARSPACRTDACRDTGRCRWSCGWSARSGR